MGEYQVIARKYRPQCFADVVGQEHVVRTLKNAIIQNRTAHAYLFVGPRGVGKTTLARIFAKAMNCENPRNGEPCCKCRSCLAIAADNALDLIEIDAASHNSAGEMRELNEEVMHRPVQGRYKIYIIDEVHMLSKQAWNALLKTVEEPPSHVKFIFATTEVHQVLPTIISRCQRFDLLPIPVKLIAGRLKYIVEQEKVKIEDGAINAIARAADGGMRDAQSLLDQMIAFFAGDGNSEITAEQVLSLFGLTDTEDLLKLTAAMFNNEPGEVVKVVHRLAGKGKNLETLYEDVLSALRGVEMCQLLKDPAQVLDADSRQLDFYRQFAAAVKPDTVQIMLEILSPAGRVLHDALNKQIFLESIFLRAMREAHAVRLDAILARLNELRGKGELDFLEKIPAADAPQTKIVVEVKPSGAPDGEKKIKLSPEAATAENKSVHEIQAGAAEAAEEVKAVSQSAVDTGKNIVKAEKAVASAETDTARETGEETAVAVPEPDTSKDAESETAVGAENGSVPEKKVESQVVSEPLMKNSGEPPFSPEDIAAAEIDDIADNQEDEETAVGDFGGMENIPEAGNMSALKGEEIPEVPVSAPGKSEKKKEKSVSRAEKSKPAGVADEDGDYFIGKARHSVLFEEPGAVDEAAKEPFVGEVLGLFGGRVIDVHK